MRVLWGLMTIRIGSRSLGLAARLLALANDLIAASSHSHVIFVGGFNNHHNEDHIDAV